MKTIKEIAADLASQFTSSKRNDGTVFWHLKAESDNRYSEVVREIHGVEFMPDDFKFSTIVGLLDKIQEYDSDDMSAFQDWESEIVDSLVDIYNSDLCKWLASNNLRASYVDDAVSELGYPSDIIKALQYGQYKEIQDLYLGILSYIEDEQDRLTEHESES